MELEMPIVRRFVFNGSASAFGGHVRRPDDQFLKSVAAHLPVTGGLSEAHIKDSEADKYHYKEVVKFGEAYACVRGDFTNPEEAVKYTHGQHQQNPLPTVTTVVSRLCDLEINALADAGEDTPSRQFCVKKAEVNIRTVADPATGLKTTRSFQATFEGITLSTGGGKKIELNVSTELQVFAENESKATLIEKYKDPTFRGQYARLFLPLGVELKTAIENLEGKRKGPLDATFVSGFDWIGGEQPAGTEIKGNRLTIPGLGKIFFGELLIDDHFQRATLLRFELGSITGGDTCGSLKSHPMALGTRLIPRKPYKIRDWAVLILTCLLVGCKAQTSAAAYEKIQHQIEAGQFFEARKAAEAAWQAAPNTEWGWTFKSQYIEVLIYGRELSHAGDLLNGVVPTSFHKLQPRYEYLRGYLLDCQHQYIGAMKHISAAIDLAKVENDLVTQGNAWNELAILEEEQGGSKDQTTKLFAQTLEFAQRTHSESVELQTLTNLGDAMHSLGRFADGAAYLRRGVELARHRKLRYPEAQILSNLAGCYLGLGDLGQALRSFKASAGLLQPDDPKSVRSDVLMGLGKISSLQRRDDEAVQSFRDAFKIVQAEDTLQLYVPAAERLATGLIEQHQIAEAEKFNELAHDALGNNKDSYELAWYELNRGDIALQNKHPSNAEALYRKVLDHSRNEIADVRWSAFARLAELDAARGDNNAARKNFEGALHAIEQNRVQQKGVENQISFLSALMRFYQGYVEFLVKQGKPWEALAVADSSRASLLTQGLQSSRDIPDFKFQVSKQARGSNCVLLFYWLAPQKSYVWLVTPETLVLKELAGANVIANDVKAYSTKIQTGDEDPLTALNPFGLHLFETLVGPVANYLPKGTRVVLVPDGALHGLNFETLLVKGGATHYWLDDVTLTVAPSLRVLLQKNTVAQASDKALIIGDGIYAGDPYDPLPESKREVANLNALFTSGNATVFTQREAIPEAYKKAKPQMFSLIHFSAHVEADVSSPLDSAIILSPGQYGNRQLSARDLMQSSPLNADLVTISGCNSAGKNPLAGEGMVGFAWAAFQAGARNALTSLWEVDDESTSDLMNTFYTGVRRNHIAYAESLHSAKLSLLKGKYKKPYYWAPFQLYSRNLGDNRKPMLQAKR